MDRGKNVKQRPKPTMGSGKSTTCQRRPEMRSSEGMKKPRTMPMKMTRDCSRVMIDWSRREFQAIEPRKNVTPASVYPSQRTSTYLGMLQYAADVKCLRRKAPSDTTYGTAGTQGCRTTTARVLGNRRARWTMADGMSTWDRKRTSYSQRGRMRSEGEANPTLIPIRHVMRKKSQLSGARGFIRKTSTPIIM